jgi:hypothetical protein
MFSAKNWRWIHETFEFKAYILASERYKLKFLLCLVFGSRRGLEIFFFSTEYGPTLSSPPTSYLMGTGGTFPGEKAAEEWS